MNIHMCIYYSVHLYMHVHTQKHTRTHAHIRIRMHIQTQNAFVLSVCVSFCTILTSKNVLEDPQFPPPIMC